VGCGHPRWRVRWAGVLVMNREYAYFDAVMGMAMVGIRFQETRARLLARLHAALHTDRQVTLPHFGPRRHI